jgi:hypothetical protein
MNNDLMYSEEYANFIMDTCAGDITVCNSTQLLDAMEAGYLFDEFLVTVAK